MVISISLSESDLQRIKDVLGIDTYDETLKYNIRAHIEDLQALNTKICQTVKD